MIRDICKDETFLSQKAEPATPEEIASLVQTLEKSMRDHARNLEFEEAAVLRDRIRALRERMIALS